MSQMTVYQAIDRMRELSKQRIPFSFSFMSWSETKQTCDGIIEVRSARLINKSKEAEFQNADMIEPYTDLDINEPRRFYHPTLMTFNGKRLILT